MDHHYHHQGNQGIPKPKTERLTERRKQIIRKFKDVAANQGITQINDTWKLGLLGVMRREEQSPNVSLHDINRWIKNHRWISLPVEPQPPAEEDPVVYAPQVIPAPPPPIYIPPGQASDEVNVDDLFEPPPYVEDEVEVLNNSGAGDGSVHNEEMSEAGDQININDEHQTGGVNGGAASGHHLPADHSFGSGQSVLLQNSHTEEVVHIVHQYGTPQPPNPGGMDQVNGQQMQIGGHNHNGAGNTPVPQYQFQQFGYQEPMQQLHVPQPYINGYPMYPPMYFPQYPQLMWTPPQPLIQGQPEPVAASAPSDPPGQGPAPANHNKLDQAAKNTKTAILNMIQLQKYFQKYHSKTPGAQSRCSKILRHLRHRYEDILEEGTITYHQLHPSRQYKKEVILEDQIQQNGQERAS